MHDNNGTINLEFMAATIPEKKKINPMCKRGKNDPGATRIFF